MSVVLLFARCFFASLLLCIIIGFARGVLLTRNRPKVTRGSPYDGPALAIVDVTCESPHAPEDYTPPKSTSGHGIRYRLSIDSHNLPHAVSPKTFAYKSNTLAIHKNGPTL